MEKGKNIMKMVKLNMMVNIKMINMMEKVKNTMKMEKLNMKAIF